MTVARYTLAVNRLRKKEDGQSADFISCVAFRKTAEFAEQYLHKGSKIAAEGRIISGSYKDKEGNNRYTTEVVVERCEFAESKQQTQEAPEHTPDDFVAVEEGINIDDLPFE